MVRRTGFPLLFVISVLAFTASVPAASAATCRVKASALVDEGYHRIHLSGYTQNLTQISCGTLRKIVRGAFRDFVDDPDVTDTARSEGGRRYYISLKLPFLQAFAKSRGRAQVMDIADGAMDPICRIRWRGRQTQTKR